MLTPLLASSASEKGGGRRRGKVVVTHEYRDERKAIICAPHAVGKAQERYRFACKCQRLFKIASLRTSLQDSGAERRYDQWSWRHPVGNSGDDLSQQRLGTGQIAERP